MLQTTNATSLENHAWHTLESSVVLERLNTSFESGLSEIEVALRLERDGLNELSNEVQSVRGEFYSSSSQRSCP